MSEQNPQNLHHAGNDSSPPLPRALLAELTHRCPLQCPYCSNPVALERKSGELTTAQWQEIIEQAAELGVLHIHFSGGEPTARPDITQLIAHARKNGLYSNLITSGVLLNQGKIDALAKAGLDHVQISIQDYQSENANRIGGYRGGHEKKMELARSIRALGLPLTINAVIHRQNIANLEQIIDLAHHLDAARLEVAHTQYYGWALKNRAALIPTRAQVEATVKIVQSARKRLKGAMVIDFVVPDYYARYPKPCMGGWGQVGMNIDPKGRVLPCHGAQTIKGLVFDRVGEKTLREIWFESDAFNAYRGEDWMEEPCRSCDRRQIDWGGCRCQAFALAGRATATDPACSLSENHARIVAMAEAESQAGNDEFTYRNYSR